MRLRKERRTTILKKKPKAIDPNTMMQFTKEPIKESLLETASEYQKEAKAAFVLIMKYMQDYPNKK